MSYYLRFDKLITNGRIRNIVLTSTNPTAKPDNRKVWLILSGVIQFITGTTFSLRVLPPDEGVKQIWQIDSTEPTDFYALFGNYSSSATHCMPTWCPIIVTDVDIIKIHSGAATDVAYLTVLEWDV